jgi:hypothetical protein
LRGWDESKEPDLLDKNRELARLYWPLVLTTNYDDLYWSAAAGRGRSTTILGRQLTDCHRVLRSLDESMPPILWTLQGFVGGQFTKADQIIHDPTHRHALVNELVVGHQQYQRAINADAHFRRAFAEVFRRRSLLFLGSGLAEDYFVNLFSEIIHHHGPGSHPHFAFIAEEEKERFDERFLQVRLGIVPVFYGRYDDLPAVLERFASEIMEEGQRGPRVRLEGTRPTMVGFDLAPQHRKTAVHVTLRNDKLPFPRLRRECSVVSVGRWANEPMEGRFSTGYIRAAIDNRVVPERTAWTPETEEPAYVFRYRGSNIFAVAARRRNMQTRHHDSRDLAIIPEAVCTTLRHLDGLGFSRVLLGAVASGPEAPWPAIHPFAQTLRGIREFVFASEVRKIRHIELFVVDPSVWGAVITRKLPVSELLTSELVRHRVLMTDTEGSTEIFTVMFRETPSLETVLKYCHIDRARWNVKIVPEPSDAPGEEDSDPLITSTMSVELSPKGQATPLSDVHTSDGV